MNAPEEGTAMAASSIAFTMYPVTDVARATTFYRDVLGLRPEMTLEYWVEFDVGGSTFGIGNFEQVGSAGTAQSLALEVPELDAFRARLAEHGVTATEPHDLETCRISVVADPDGNRIWLHEKKTTA
jgi:catechol 2,3-dioxygenase-like lactoylglutathione lyase family enzyme